VVAVLRRGKHQALLEPQELAAVARLGVVVELLTLAAEVVADAMPRLAQAVLELSLFDTHPRRNAQSVEL
jgi:hypothetical protein